MFNFFSCCIFSTLLSIYLFAYWLLNIFSYTVYIKLHLIEKSSTVSHHFEPAMKSSLNNFHLLKILFINVFSHSYIYNLVSYIHLRPFPRIHNFHNFSFLISAQIFAVSVFLSFLPISQMQEHVKNCPFSLK